MTICAISIFRAVSINQRSEATNVYTLIVLVLVRRWHFFFNQSIGCLLMREEQLSFDVEKTRISSFEEAKFAFIVSNEILRLNFLGFSLFPLSFYP